MKSKSSKWLLVRKPLLKNVTANNSYTIFKTVEVYIVLYKNQHFIYITKLQYSTHITLYPLLILHTKQVTSSLTTVLEEIKRENNVLKTGIAQSRPHNDERIDANSEGRQSNTCGFYLCLCCRCLFCCFCTLFCCCRLHHYPHCCYDQ